MNKLCFVLCVLAAASASPEHRTRDQQTPAPYPIPFSHVANPYSAVLPTRQPNSEVPIPISPYVFRAELPSPYSTAGPFGAHVPARPYSTSGPFKYLPSLYESPSENSVQPHETEASPSSYWPYPTQVFYASQYYPHLPYHPETPSHHTENHPSPTHSTAKPLKPHNPHYVETHSQHMNNDHEVLYPSVSPVKPFHPHHSPSYHITYGESNYDTQSTPHYSVHYPDEYGESNHAALAPHYPHHSVHYPEEYGESNHAALAPHYPHHSAHYPHPHEPTPKPPKKHLTTEQLLQYLQHPLSFRNRHPVPSSPQPPRMLLLQPLDTHSGGASGATPETSGDNMEESQLPPTRRHIEASEDRKSPQPHVMWETMYRPIHWPEYKWIPKWYPKWEDLKGYSPYHLWNKWGPVHWLPGKKESAIPHHDPHMTLEPWDHVTVPHVLPPSNPYYPRYPSKSPPPSNYPHYDGNHPHTLDTYLQQDEPWSNQHLRDKLVQGDEKNPAQQSYQPMRDPMQFYHHHKPAVPGYNVFPLPGRGALTVARAAARRSDAPVGAGDLEPSQEEDENLPPPPSEYDRDVETPSQPSRTDDGTEFHPEARLMSTGASETEDQSQDVDRRPNHSSLDDVIDSRPSISEDSVLPVVHPSYSSDDVIDSSPSISEDSPSYFSDDVIDSSPSISEDAVLTVVHPWLPPSYSSDDVIDSSPSISEDSMLPVVHPWLPPSYFYPPTPSEVLRDVRSKIAS